VPAFPYHGRLVAAIHHNAAAARVLSAAMKTSPPAGRPTTTSAATSAQQAAAAAVKSTPGSAESVNSPARSPGGRYDRRDAALPGHSCAYPTQKQRARRAEGFAALHPGGRPLARPAVGSSAGSAELRHPCPCCVYDVFWLLSYGF